MCGIVGEYLFNEKPSKDNFELLLDKIKSRGPDYSGFVVKDHIILGHSRLSIIDLSSASNQPFEDDEAELSMVYNGCIYNYIELRAELIKIGHSFKTNGDTEVVLKSYKEWGPESLSRFEGDFAIAIWDNRERKLFLARDRFGVKPLYYADEKNFFRFGSTLQSIIVKKDIDLQLDPESLHMHFTLHAVVPAPNTIFKNIKKVPPGHYLTIDENKKILFKKYWSLDNLNKNNYITDEKEALYLTKKTLKESIDKRLSASDTDVGVLLSGGLDSSLIVALAKDKFPNLKTYSIGFDDDQEEKGSEFYFSDQVVEKFNTNHKKFIINNDSVLHKLPDAFKSMSEPMVAQDAIAFFMLSELVSKEVKVVLSGQGADEAFAGYFWYQNIALEKNHHKNFAKHYFDRSNDEMKSFLNINFDEDFSLKMIEKNFKDIGSKSLLRNVLNFDITTLVVDDPVKRVDNMTMAWGLEARVPFLDHKLIELSSNIDANMHLKRNGKKLLKDISDNLLPNEIISRKKGYFPMPALKFIRGEYYDFVYDILNSSECYNRNLYNKDYIDKLLKQPNEHKTAIDGNKLWHAAATELWLQKNLY
jgi:asparagine synthase (glutamine-hydrolysing)|tara:strand:- start:6051 stop:7814 length:1764 start_codon:yes stop_codon:yes gene_type:complete